MNKLQAYMADSWNELKNKVTWPTWPELQASAIVVAVAAIFIALTVFIMDGVASTVLGFIYKSF